MIEVDLDAFLAHHGVKGMKWGVRNEESNQRVDRDDAAELMSLPMPRSIAAQDLKPNADGSIDIPRGSTIQRVVNHGKTIGSSGGTDFGGNVTYAAFTKGDKLRYESAFGYTKNLFVKESSQVLTLTTKTALKAPTPGKTSELYFKSLKENPEKLDQVKSHLKRSSVYSDKGFEKLMTNPGSPNAYSLFGTLYDAGNYNVKLAGVNDVFHGTMKKSGFNMLLDPSDSTFGGIYDAPIAVLDGSKNLAISGRVVATKESRKSVNQALKDYDKIDKGKKLMQRLGYDQY